MVLSEVHNVVFDLGGVLLEWDPESIVAAVFEAPQVQAACGGRCSNIPTGWPWIGGH
jgi:FMN phosphatase YigB (HAD superfamily)